MWGYLRVLIGRKIFGWWLRFFFLFEKYLKVILGLRRGDDG